MISDRIRVVDADTHVVEPPDLWTSRLAAKWGDLIPHVEADSDSGEEFWCMGGRRLTGAAKSAMAGWNEYPPDHPRRFADVPAALFEVGPRLAYMDEMGIWAQLLYPNVALFHSGKIRGVGDAELQLEIVRAYNDWQSEWSAGSDGRLVPITSLPFWDVEASVAELQRCAGADHRGGIFTQNPPHFGLPPLEARHWDPLWAAAQEMGMPINFHIASAADFNPVGAPDPANGPHANHASTSVGFFLDNARTFAQLICGGVCHRFPDLDFVSVESGIGWIPFAMASLDWQWKNSGVRQEHPEYDLLPSEYYRRQLYGCFWFEEETALAAIEVLGPDNVLFETDFPHPTSMSPGPASAAVRPRDYIEGVLGSLPEQALSKVLHGNAARVYRLADR